MSETGWYRVHFRKSSIVVHGEAELARIRARKTPKVVLVEPAKTHECSICHKVEAWGPTWLWFGSYKQIDDDVPVAKFCSETCAGQHKQREKARAQRKAYATGKERAPTDVGRP